MKGLDYLRMSFGNVDAKLPPLKEVKPQHPLGKFSDYEDALDELCINALAKLTPEQREIIFRRCSRNIRSWEKMMRFTLYILIGIPILVLIYVGVVRLLREVFRKDFWK